MVNVSLRIEKKKKLSESFITPSHSINMRYDSFWSIQIDKKKISIFRQFSDFCHFSEGHEWAYHEKSHP